MASKSFRFILYFSFTIFMLIHSINFSQEYKSSGHGWSIAELYVNTSTLPVLQKSSDTAKQIHSLKFNDKVLALRNENEISDVNFIKIIYPYRGYVLSNHLSTAPYKDPAKEELLLPSNHDWNADIVRGNNRYNFIKEKADYSSPNLATIKSGEPIVIIKQQYIDQQTWLKVVYPEHGFINFTDIESNTDLFTFEFGFTFAPVNIPYEKAFKNDTNPIGAYIKFSNDTWNMGLRIYYTIEKTKTKMFGLETHRVGLEINYDFLKLFEDKLIIYGFAGGGYWSSTFENTKYSNMSYYKTEASNGPMYNAGAGFSILIYDNFVFDVHYSWFGTEEGVFGADPIPGEFMNQYRFFISSHQLYTSIGYKIEL